MRLDAEQIWEAIREKLRHLVNKEIFDLWFGRITPLGLSGGALALGVPDEFCRIWIEDNYSGLLRDMAVQVWPEITTVQLILHPTAAVVPPQDGGAEKDAPPLVGVPRPDPAASPRHFPSRKTAVLPFNPKNTFENFVVGPCNHLAHAAALAVARNPGRAYNPLFLYGGTGLGKTHLVQAIGSYIQAQGKLPSVLYVSCETFVNDYVAAIQSQSLPAFRRRYRQADVLLIDDVHFLSGKERLQEEFFHTFNALFESRKQIVLSSDRPAAEIADLESRLVSRFEWGLVTEITSPDFETRFAILRAKLASLNAAVEPQILEFIAHQIKSNIRRLEGALVRAASYTSLSGKPLDLPTAARLLGDLLRQERGRAVDVGHIQKVVADYFALPPSELTSRRRLRSVAIPRQVAMFLSRQLTTDSLSAIGQKFGRRDHGTVIHACRVIERKMKEDPAIRRTIELLSREIGENP